MYIITGLIIGIIQAFTEFLPISSSAHTLIIYSFLNIANIDIVLLEVVIHFGTLCAIVLYFRKQLWEYINSLYRTFFKKNTTEIDKINNNSVKVLFVGIIPVGIIGYFFQDFIEQFLHNEKILPFTLILVAILFIITEKYAKQQKGSLQEITWKDALLIGSAQVIALIPGTSRSGITIITGMGQGFSRKLAAEFTFLLAIPTIFGITLKKFFDISINNFTSQEFIFYGTAFFISFILGYVVIKYFLAFLGRHSLRPFAYYRIILGILLIIFFYFV